MALPRSPALRLTLGERLASEDGYSRVDDGGDDDASVSFDAARPGGRGVERACDDSARFAHAFTRDEDRDTRSLRIQPTPPPPSHGPFNQFRLPAATRAIAPSGFSIDSCPTTNRLESEFLSVRHFRTYTSGTPTTETVLFSRTLQEHYTLDDRYAYVTSDDLDVFRGTGHTLSVDNTRSYIRMCAFDLDCMHRKRYGQLHLGESTANDVSEALKGLLHEITKHQNIVCVLWVRDCGFHLYTNVPVSMPLHLELGERLNAAFRNREVIIEVPTYMPLPFSAKERGVPYEPLLFGQSSVPLLGTTPYYDRYELKKPPLCDADTLVAEMDTRCGPLLLVCANKTSLKSGVPKLSLVNDVRLSPIGGYLSQLLEYVDHVRDTGTTTAAAQSDLQPAFRDVPDRIVALFSTEQFETFLKTFYWTHFNLTRSDADARDYSRFVEISAVEKGALYLQHYAVALYKCMSPVSDEDFRLFLKAMYERVLENDPGVARFTDRYSVHTSNGYNDRYDTILEVLSIDYMNNRTIGADLETYINETMCTLLGVQTVEAWSTLYRRLRGPEKETKKYQALDAYINIMSRTKYLTHFDHTWYAYTNDAYYNKLTTINNVPCLSMWVNLDENARRHVETYSRRFTEQSMWSNCDFMFATSVGIFNSLTGLYSAKVPVLRFEKSRNCAVWGLDRPLTMYEEQNRDVLDLSRVTEPFVDILYNRMTELFLNFQIIPAIIQLQHVYNVDDERMCRFFELFENHYTIDSAHFLVEYYPVDPKFIYAIMYMYTEYGLETLLNYNKLVEGVFTYRTGVTSADWAEMFQPKLALVEFDRNAPDHMTRLLSLRGTDLDGKITKDFCLYSVLISVVMIKCFSFRPLLSAFGISELPVCADEALIPEHYRGVEYSTSLDCYKRILKQTVSTVYGDKLTVFEERLAQMTVQVGMSVCFDPETARELVNMVSAVYVPRNVLKKLMILTGPQHTGKSYFCDLITELAAPFVARFHDIRKAADRTAITTKTNVTIINEASSVNPHHMKSVTGNDGESAQVFYSQVYELHKVQCLIYGATNNVIEFKENEKRMHNIDRTTVERIHAITLNGAQIYESDDKYRNDSIFTMVAMSRFFNGVITVPQDISARALGWLAYMTYYHHRDANNNPNLNTSNPHVLAYQQLVYYKNNSLYAFLAQSGITEEPGFYIDARSVIATAHRSIEEKVHFKTIATYGDFESLFNLHYNVRLRSVNEIQGLQFTALIEHIKVTMETVKGDGQRISEAELEDRLTVYGTSLNRSNAREYFKRRNTKVYEPKSRLFVGVKFVHDTADSYGGNAVGDALNAAGNGGFRTGDCGVMTSLTSHVIAAV